MTRRSLTPRQATLLDLIEDLGFGRVERLLIHDGEPCCEQTKRIVQELKLGTTVEHQPGHSNADLALPKEFVALFDALDRLRDGIVDIEIRHCVPFRLILDRTHRELDK